MRSIFISATKRSSGKTTLAVGLTAVLKDRGMQVQPFKKGPDFIDPMWLGNSAGRCCINLDFNTMSAEEIAHKFASYCEGRDIAVVEGNMGLFDGLDSQGQDSNAALATLLGIPVLLVVDCQGMTRGVAPLLQGYSDFDPAIRFAGVVLNNVADSRHESKLRRAIEEYTDASVIGAMPRQRTMTIPERNLGLTTHREDDEAGRHIEAIAAVARQSLDIDLLLQAVDRQPTRLSYGFEQKEADILSGISLGIARDDAFCFYYEDDLKTMERAGAKLCFFSPLEDAGPPDVDALFIGGGFPENHVEALHANTAMRQALLRYCQSGRPVYAECGGLMYLSRKISQHTRSHEMVNFLPVDTVMLDRPVGRGYVSLIARPSHPWINFMSGEGEALTASVNAHEFHYSALENLEDGGTDFAWRVERGYGLDGQHDGLIRQGVLASYSHLRNSRSSPWISQFSRYIKQQSDILN